jgi:hypothetical protein
LDELSEDAGFGVHPGRMAQDLLQENTLCGSNREHPTTGTPANEIKAQSHFTSRNNRTAVTEH